MAKVNYRTCDICGCVLSTDIRCRGYTNGFLIWNKIFNELDICNKCLDKIRHLSTDKKDEEKYLHEMFENGRKYDDCDMQSAYYEGLEDALQVLSHKRLKDIKIPRDKR